jgi:uncharacterized protein
VLLDANLLLYAIDRSSPFQERAAWWLTDVLNGDQRVALPWQTMGAFLRIATHPRITAEPLRADVAWSIVDGWLEAPAVWVPEASWRTAHILGELLRTSGATGNLVTDAQLAAIAIEHGLEVQTADTDFARFPQVRWQNPL